MYGKKVLTVMGFLRGRIRAADDTGSMAMALLLTIVGMSLTALVVPAVVVQSKATAVATRRVDAVNAAQAGLEVALGQIRQSGGVLNSLPNCNGTLSGAVGGGSATYAVTISYRNSSNAVLCASGKPATVPTTAVLTSDGTQGPVTRTLSATYTFQSTNANIPGGLINVFSSTTCLDATSANPAAGTVLKVRTCDSNKPEQKFAYYTDLTIVLVGSVPPKCLDADTPHAAGRSVRLQLCVTPAPARQRWVANGHANFEGTADSVTKDGTCFNVKNPGLSVSDVILGTNADETCQEPHDNQQTFMPEANVGAGASGPPQLVNYSLFGRCVDVPGGTNYLSRAWMISWPCKQSFNRVTQPVAANESWTLPTKVDGPAGNTGFIRVVDDGADNTIGTGDDIAYCLQSSGNNTYPTLSASCSTMTTAKTWTVFWDTGTYATSYRIKDGYGNCLQPTDPEASPPDFHGDTQADLEDEISKIIVTTCRTAAADLRLQELQKWNAPANVTGVVPLKNINEN